MSLKTDIDIHISQIASEKLVVEPAPHEMGDFATAVFAAAKQIGKDPSMFAIELSDALRKTKLSETFDITTSNGYVNFRIKPEVLQRIVASISDKYGTVPSNGIRVLLEHTSANPTGPIHIGRARNPIIGDSLARLLRVAGFTVTTEYFVNDMGKQVATMVWGLDNGMSYAQASVNPDETAISTLLQDFENGLNSEKFRSAVDNVLKQTVKTLSRINVVIDNWTYESSFVFDESTERVLQQLSNAKALRSEGNAAYVVVNDEKLFLTRNDGTSLYALRDMAYHVRKSNLFDLVVNLMGEDHKRTMDQLRGALSLIGTKNLPLCVFYAFVGLPDGKKMSTRSGTAILLDDILDDAIAKARIKLRENLPRGKFSNDDIERLAQQIGCGALRFALVKTQPDRAIVFDVNDALSFDGATAPYVQYAHARICSLLRTAEKSGSVIGTSLNGLNEPNEINLMRVLAKYPDLILSCSESGKVHPLANYCVELAQTFASFYDTCHVFCDDEQIHSSRLKLCEATNIVLKNAMEILGIELPVAM